jgi:predicted RND superfamily exporter protein
LPSLAATGPRVVSGPDLATTEAGRQLQGEQLRKKAGQAFGALLAVAILQVIGTFVMYSMAKNAGTPGNVANIVLAVMLGVAALFAALAVWARSSPLPPAIVGLVVYVTLLVIDAVAAPETILNGIIIKIVIIMALAKAVQAGAQYKQLLAQSRSQGGSSQA